MQKQIIHVFFKKVKKHNFSVKYWDEEVVNYGNGDPDMKIVFNKPLSNSCDFSDPMLAIGEAYMNDIIDFHGDFDEVIGIANDNVELFNGNNNKLFNKISKMVNNASLKAKQKENVTKHYDLGNDFFSLWLDETMSYSCAYFKNPTDDLYGAQLNKIDHILKKLQLKPGERLLDIGSGWGWLIIRAAQEYGVKATGITISEEQYKGTLERIEKLGLTEQVDVKLMDYLDLNAMNLNFEKIVSVGMFEHVGKENLHRYMGKVEELLVPGGLSLLHSIMGHREDFFNSWMERYIFPGAYTPSLRETINIMPEYDFRLINAESLRMHYALTLDHWYNDYSQHWDAVEKKYGRRFARMWELYLKGCASNFRVAGLDIYQLLFSKGANNHLSLTSDHVYR